MEEVTFADDDNDGVMMNVTQISDSEMSRVERSLNDPWMSDRAISIVEQIQQHHKEEQGAAELPACVSSCSIVLVRYRMTRTTSVVWLIRSESLRRRASNSPTL